MTIREEENGLFDRWKKERCYDSFVRDGVFDEAVWMTQSPKITFILKEADWPGGDGNLRRNLFLHLLSRREPADAGGGFLPSRVVQGRA